jgi:hypothetical protein
MILEFLLNIIFGIIDGFLSLLPELPGFSEFQGLLGFVEILSYGSIFIDLNVFLTCLFVWFALWQFEFVYAILEWLWHKIPGVD